MSAELSTEGRWAVERARTYADSYLDSDGENFAAAGVYHGPLRILSEAVRLLTSETETQYMLMVDFQSPHTKIVRVPLGACGQRHALNHGRELLATLAHFGVGKIEVYVREVPAEWTKVDEIAAVKT